MKNEFKLLFTVKQSKHNGLWLITVEGVCVASAETEDEAWDWVENTWSKFPMDSVKEIREQIEMQILALHNVIRRRPEDADYEVARVFQRISELANAGLRVALLGRASK